MSLYTLMLATVINVNKELPVQAGLTLDDCVAAAMQALQKNSNYAKCRPTQPEKPVVLIKLPGGLIVQVERKDGGYALPAGHTVADHELVAIALGRPSSGVHSGAHGPDRMLKADETATTVAAE
jgi:hypothetical protein